MDNDKSNITEERAARRFHQIAMLERQLQVTSGAIVQCKQHLKDLTDEQNGVLARIRAAARDTGELPLFSLDE